MRLIQTCSVLKGRLDFLDTADWSYLETNRDPGSTASLQSLGETGRVTFIVTQDHLVEAAGLRSGLRNRLAFLREFPGTVFWGFGGSQLLRLAAFEFAINALGGDQSKHPFECVAMNSQSLNELVMKSERTRPLRLAHRFRALVAARTSRINLGKSKEEQGAERKLQRLARIGDRRKFEAHLTKTSRRMGGLRGHIRRCTGRLLLPLYDWASSRGLLSRTKHADFLFDQLVTSVLPPAISTDEQIMTGLAMLWTQPEVLALMCPSLALVKAMATTQRSTLDAQKIESTEYDKYHAAFAPLVDVFTCDRRNQPLVAQTLTLARLETCVLRTDSLSQLVDLLAKQPH